MYLTVFHTSQVLDRSRYSHGNIKFLEEKKMRHFWYPEDIFSNLSQSSLTLTLHCFQYQRQLMTGSLPHLGMQLTVKGESQRSIRQREEKKQ